MGAKRLRDYLNAFSSDNAILIVAGALAVAVPFAASRYLNHQLRGDVEPALSAALGEDVSIGSVEASLTGSVRLEDVRVGGLFRADALEASVGTSSLLSGSPGADEIRISGPRLRTRLDRTGENRVRRVIRRAAAARKSATAGRGTGAAPGRLRRILVTDGELRIDLEGRGMLSVHGVELHPQRGGVRFIASAVDVDLLGDGLTARGSFGRVAADLSLPAAGVRRAVATDGTLALSGDFPTTRLADLVITGGVDDADLRAVATVDGGEPGARLELTVADGTLRVSGERMPLAPLSAIAPGWIDLRAATATGSVVLESNQTTLGARVDTELFDAALNDPRVAHERVPFAGHLAVSAELGDAGLIVHDATMRIGEVALTTRANIELSRRDAARRGTIAVQLPVTPCMSVLRAMPEVTRRRLAGMYATGTMSADVSVAFDRDNPDATELDIAVDMSRCRVTREPSEGNALALLEPFEHTFPDGSTRTVGRGHPGHARIDSLPPELVGAFVAAEDARYFRHNGFDARQIEASLRVDISEGELVRGGSTITQQLAKNVFLEPRRNFARKLEEAVLAWRMEARLSKREMLEVYLNIIELGDGVYGVADASRYWFDKTPRELTVREIAFLAVLTPAPRTISQRVRTLRKPDKYTAHRIDVVLRHMRRGGVISDRRYQRAKRDRLSIRAPRLAQKHEGRALVSGDADVGMIERR